MPQIDQFPIAWDPIQIIFKLWQRLNTNIKDRGVVLSHVAFIKASEPRASEVFGFQHMTGLGGLGGKQVPEQLGSHSQVLSSEISDE